MKPTLLILAAGMGSRYGGIKQIDSVGAYGQTLLDYGIFDAKEAGFEKVVFVIRKSIEKEFRHHLFDRVARNMDASYVFQHQDSLLSEEQRELSAARIKPWGTIHAVLCAREEIPGSFAVINADDYYGKTPYVTLYNHLATTGDRSRGWVASPWVCMFIAPAGYKPCRRPGKDGRENPALQPARR